MSVPNGERIKCVSFWSPAIHRPPTPLKGETLLGHISRHDLSHGRNFSPVRGLGGRLGAVRKEDAWGDINLTGLSP